MLLVAAGAGNAFANSFGGQQEISSYTGTPYTAEWRATITNTGHLDGCTSVTWDNEWYNWASYNIKPRLDYWYQDNEYKYTGSWVGYGATTQSPPEATISEAGNQIVGIYHIYINPDYSQGYTNSPAPNLKIDA
jgi:hypothetical protein